MILFKSEAEAELLPGDDVPPTRFVKEGNVLLEASPPVVDDFLNIPVKRDSIPPEDSRETSEVLGGTPDESLLDISSWV